ncbi:hypothetical protein [Streptomyces sp. NPDC001537]
MSLLAAAVRLSRQETFQHPFTDPWRAASAAGTARAAGLREALPQRMFRGTRTAYPESARHQPTDEDNDCNERYCFEAHEIPLSERTGCALTDEVNKE